MPSGPLVSELLSGNDRLQRCAQTDPAHVQPNDLPSDHVQLIQEALRRVDGANIPAGERNYGKFTTEAVVKFKTKHSIFTRGTRQIDPITGINTIRKLDELLKLEDDKRKKKVDPPLPEKAPKLVLSGQCQVVGELADNPQADDMKFADPIASRKSAATATITAPFAVMSENQLEAAMLAAMSTAVAVAGGTATNMTVRAAALQLCQEFFTLGGIQHSFPKGSVVADEAKTDPGFLEFVSRIQFEINPAVRKAWKAGLVDDRAIALSLRPKLDSPGFGTGKCAGALAAFIGGFQGYHVEMCGFTADTAAKTFTYSLDVEIFDHFGVDDTDINRPGGGFGLGIGASMASFFVLQHDRSGLPQNALFRKYRPFRVSLRTDVGPFTANAF